MENDYLYSSSDSSVDNSDGDLIIFEESSSGSSEVVEESSGGSSEVVEESSGGSSEVVEESSSGSSEVVEESSSGSSDVGGIDYTIYFDDISSKLDTLILQTNGVQEYQTLTEIRDSVTENHDLQTNVNDLSLVEILLFVLCVFFGLNFVFKIGGHLL